MKIIYSVFEHTETHALNAVKRNMNRQKMYGRDPDLPLIPAADKALYPHVCGMCQKNRTWVLAGEYPELCAECEPKFVADQERNLKNMQAAQLVQFEEQERIRLRVAREEQASPSRAEDPRVDPAPPTPPNELQEDLEKVLSKFFGKLREVRDSADRRVRR